jgi:hypothetical protein
VDDNNSEGAWTRDAVFSVATRSGLGRRGRAFLGVEREWGYVVCATDWAWALYVEQAGRDEDGEP